VPKFRTSISPDQSRKQLFKLSTKALDQKTRFRIVKIDVGVAKQHQQDKDRKDKEILKSKAN
jgi:hypothetical protein